MALLRTARTANTVLFTVFLLSLLLVYTGWWQLAFVAGYVGGFLGMRARREFVLGFLGVGFGWGAHLAWTYATAAGAALASLFAQVLGLPAGAGVVVPVLTLVIGGITGGLGALLGAYAGQLYATPRPVGRPAPHARAPPL